MIYCRYSSDMQNPKSCADQEREVRQALARMGIDDSNAIVIHDAGESGTKTLRDEFQHLQQMVRAGEVGMLVVDDQARLTRANNAYSFILDLVYAGGRFLSSGEGIDTMQPGWELRVKVMELHNSATIGELSRRVRRGQSGRILSGLTAGDYPYGYESFLVHPDRAYTGRGPKPEKNVRINEEEARWVRQIFEWFLAKWSVSGIARELTRLKVPRPHGSKGNIWSHQQVHRVLENEKYIGTWSWGKTTTIRNSKGQTKQIPTSEDQWSRVERPDLRIIDQATWDQAQKRLRELHAIYGLQNGQKPRGPQVHHTAVYPGSLLGGLIHCGECGRRMWQESSGKRMYLGCADRGVEEGMCCMTTRVPVQKAEQELLGFISQVLSTSPDWLKRVIEVMRNTIEDVSRTVPQTVATNESRLAKAERQIQNLASELADGTFDSPKVRQMLTEKEAEAEQLRREIEAAKRLLAVQVEMPDDGWIAQQLSDLISVLREDERRAAILLRKFLGKVFAHQVLAPGKIRGYSQLRFRILGWELLKEVLGTKLPVDVLTKLIPAEVETESEEIVLDLGSPSRMDNWAPKIAEMRAAAVPWKEIWELTGLGSGPAYEAYKRYIDAQKKLPQEEQPPPDSNSTGEQAA